MITNQQLVQEFQEVKISLLMAVHHVCIEYKDAAMFCWGLSDAKAEEFARLTPMRMRNIAEDNKMFLRYVKRLNSSPSKPAWQVTWSD
jgi:hypothetical protein